MLGSSTYKLKEALLDGKHPMSAMGPGVIAVADFLAPKESIEFVQPAHYLWAVLIARIYEVFPLLCPNCGRQMRLIAFITEGTQIRKILDHIGVDSEPSHIAPARGPPLWEDGGDAQMGEGVEIEQDGDLTVQPAPNFDADKRVNWGPAQPAILNRCGMALRPVHTAHRKSLS